MWFGSMGETAIEWSRMMTDRRDEGNKAVVTLREITPENIKAVLGLGVAPEQKSVYPRSNGYSIAEGHYPDDDDPVWMRVIYANETPVGFLMTSEAPDRGEYFMWRLMVDAEHQGKGYGSRAVKLLIERTRRQAMREGSSLATSRVREMQVGSIKSGEVLDGIDYVMEIAFLSEGSAAR
jgi:GNAT superfamily N-acetyltransferase